MTMLATPATVNQKGTPRRSAKGPAMSRKEAIAALETGIELAFSSRDAGIDLLGTGDMGIGNTTPSAAIAAVLTGRSVEQVTFRGTGIDDPTRYTSA